METEERSNSIFAVPVPVEVNVDGTITELAFALKINSSSLLSTSLNDIEKTGF